MKIALIGTAPASMRLAPYHDPSWEIWGCSPGTYGVMPRVNQFFELHLWEPGAPWFSPEYCQWLKEFPKRYGKLWVGAPIVDIPDASVLPHQEILDEFDPSGWFCTSSLFWMMAMAIKQIEADRANRGDIPGIRDAIGLWGVDMAANEEYEAQRSGLHFITYIARKRGIEVGVPLESDLFTPRFKYGVDEWTHSYRKARARRAELVGRVADAERREHDARYEVAFLRGALDDLKYMHDTWADKRSYAGPQELASEWPHA